MNELLNQYMSQYPEKFIPMADVFRNIRRGDRIYIGTGCGAPQYLIKALIEYVESNPKAFADAEIMHVWTLGLAPYVNEKFTYNFRHNSFFISDNTRDPVNRGLADYTPIFLSHVPGLIHSKKIPINISLVQTSLPDKNGFVSLGISVDITKAAIENSTLTIAQLNSNMPRVHGDSFVHISKIDFMIPYDEPLLEYRPVVPDTIAEQIGKYVARIINDGDTIQIGYGSLPNAILKSLENKKDLGVHTELLTDSIIYLIKKGIVNNSKKNIKRGKTVAAFCMGTKETYAYLDDNPEIDFNPIDFTNNPMIIAGIKNMTAINSALQVDLTGQSTSESIGDTFYSGIGGHADFMRGAILAPGGKSILVLQSTAMYGAVSRIVPLLESGVGVTLNRGDIHYIVTEFGIAYIHGKNIRERAMDLIAIAHPKFKSFLIEEAKKLKLIYSDQTILPGERGLYPEHLETYRSLQDGTLVFMRPVKINDEPMIKDFFYSLSDKSLEFRFMSMRKDIPHDMRKVFTTIDYTREMIILAVVTENEHEIIAGMGQMYKNENTHTAEVAFAVSDQFQNRGIGSELMAYIILLGRKEGLHGFNAEVLLNNQSMVRVFEKYFPDMKKRVEDNLISCTMIFND